MLKAKIVDGAVKSFGDAVLDRARFERVAVEEFEELVEQELIQPSG